MTIRVSVCTSVFNQSEFLRRAIDSVRAQTFRDWEHIIVDDGSTEDILSIVESYEDERLVYIRFPENRGFQAGYDHAVSHATGDYVELLAADEFLWERKLEIQVPWMDSHPEIGCTWGLPTPNVGKPWDLGERPSWEQYATKAHNRSREAWVRTLMLLDSIPIGGASMLMRRSLYPGFDPQFHDVSDLEMFVRFFQENQGWVLPYRFADASHPAERQSAPNAERFQDNMRRLNEKHKIALPPVPGRVTVAIPVKNMASMIPHTLASLRAQTFRDFDIIVLDDCSTDSTVKVVETIIANKDDANTSLIQLHGESVGPNAAQNHMLGLCKTEFFMVLAADDTVEPTFLERCMAEFMRDPWLELVATQTDFIGIDGKPYEEPHGFKNILKASNKSREQWLYQLYYGNQYFGAGVYRIDALREVCGWDTTVEVLGDYDMYLKLLQRENIHVIEEYLTHTRIHDNNISILKTKPEQQRLRQHYHTIKSRYYAPRMKVIIATPFYMMQGFTPYISSLVSTIQLLVRCGIEHEFWEVSGDSYIDRAKNTLANKFLEDPSATDLFMIDADMQWEPAKFVNILMLPQEIVMGSYPQKNGWDRWTAIPVQKQEDGKHYAVGIELGDGNALVEAAYLAGGFIRIKRDAMQKYKDHYTDRMYHDSGADPSYPERKYTEFFTCEIRNNQDNVPLRWGEDRIFGSRMEALGIRGWIYPNVTIGHYGIKGWTGNFDAHLRSGATAK